MASDLDAIAVCRCVGCGRESDQVSLKRLGTYSRAFSCLTCYLKYANCGNCGHEKHASTRLVTASWKEMLGPSKVGHCGECGCDDYRHGLDVEFDRQFAAHTGRAPTQRKCLHCGNWFSGKTIFCDPCDREWSALNG